MRQPVGRVFRLSMVEYHSQSSTSKPRTIRLSIASRDNRGKRVRALQKVDDQTLAKSEVPVVCHVADKTIRSRVELLQNDYTSLKPASSKIQIKIVLEDHIPVHRYSGTGAD